MLTPSPILEAVSPLPTVSITRYPAASPRQVHASYGRLHERVWNGRSLKLECAVYRAVVLSVLLCGCESWTLYRRHVKLLDQFHQRCLRRILNTKGYNRVSNAKVLSQAQIPSIDTLLIQPQLRWSDISCACRTTGYQSSSVVSWWRVIDQGDDHNWDIDEKQWEIMATSRCGWRHGIRKGTEAYENARQSSQQAKRAAMKATTITTQRSTQCPVCSCLCASDFGLG